MKVAGVLRCRRILAALEIIVNYKVYVEGTVTGQASPRADMPPPVLT